MDSAVISAFLASDCVGRVIDGRFKLLRWLGGTEQSSVFYTEIDGDAAQKAAIKLSPANAADAETRVTRWETAKTLSHPHLMRVFHAGRCKVDGIDLLYVVTEYADEVLFEILRERPLSLGETREMLSPVLEALSCLHGRKLVHGHLKPSNIMVVDDRLKLSSDRLHGVGEPGRASAWSGKYDAPEAALEPMSTAGDLWSLGIVLVEALTQRTPVWDRLTGGDPVVPVTLPPPLSGIARECLRVDPARRATLSGVQELLEATPAADEVEGGTPPSGARRFRGLLSTDRSSRKQLMMGGGVVVVIVVLVALILGFHHGGSSSSTEPSSAPAAATPLSASTTRPAGSNPASRPTPESKSEAQAPVQTSRHPAQRTQTPAEAAPAPARAAEGRSQPSELAAQPPVPAERTRAGSIVKGAVAFQDRPDVPQHILDTITGHVRVHIGVQVDADGKVTEVSLDEAGPSQYFANKALAAARNWKFTPAAVDGRAVASQWTLHFSFGQSGTTITATETTP